MARLDSLNGRLGARRAQLTGPGALRALLARPSLEAQLDLLRALPLGASLPPAAGPDPIGAIERALRDHLRLEALALVQDAEGRRARCSWHSSPSTKRRR